MQRSAFGLYPIRRATEVPALSAAQMAEVDRRTIEDAGLTLLQMMENAGRALALVIRDALRARAGDEVEAGQAPRERVLLLAGKGHNGGGALTAARHLRNWGYGVDVVLSTLPSGLNEATALALQILHRDGLRALWPAAPDFDERFPGRLAEATVVVDGLVGYSLSGPLQGDVALLVEAALDRAPPIMISLDVPTGFDASTGDVSSSGVVATVTLTLALPKSGLLTGDAAAAVGELLLADIGIPGYVYERLGVHPPADLFSEEPIVRLVTPI